MTIDDVLASTRELIWACKHSFSGKGKESLEMPTRRILAQADATERVLNEYAATKAQSANSSPQPSAGESADPMKFERNTECLVCGCASESVLCPTCAEEAKQKLQAEQESKKSAEHKGSEL